MAKCRGFLDYGPKKPCPFFDLENCETPLEPPKCPIKENKLRRPCYRYRCSNDQDLIILYHHEDIPEQIRKPKASSEFILMVNKTG
jgi:hypothetical protein